MVRLDWDEKKRDAHCTVSAKSVFFLWEIKYILDAAGYTTEVLFIQIYLIVNRTRFEI